MVVPLPANIIHVEPTQYGALGQYITRQRPHIVVLTNLATTAYEEAFAWLFPGNNDEAEEQAFFLAALKDNENGLGLDLLVVHKGPGGAA